MREFECISFTSLHLQRRAYRRMEEIKENDDFEGKKKLAADGKWGIVHIIIPEKNCDIIEIDSLSSTDVVNEYRQLLLQDRNITFSLRQIAVSVHFRHSY